MTKLLVEEGAAIEALRGGRPPAKTRPQLERFDVVVIGGGQSGLAVGYHLARRGLRFVILDASARVGDGWRRRWDSLRLFTPARYDGLDGMPFPAPPHSFPTKDEMADYLQAYAEKLKLPVQSGARVTRVSRGDDGRYLVEVGDRVLEGDHVVVAMAYYQESRVPDFASELDRSIVQIHSKDYRSPSQLREGDVLLVGAGNSAAEIAMELSRRHRVWMSGRDVGQLPFRIEGFWGRLLLLRLVLRFVFHRVLTTRTPIGRKARRKVLHIGGPLIRVKREQLAAAGVERVARVTGVGDGKPLLEDGRVLDVANVVWCTGFHPGLSWIELPIFDERGDPRHESGVVLGERGLYFVGLHFLFSLSSGMIHGVSRDAARIVETIAARAAHGQQ
jgi:putative flavoprotein involved in K+ transport